MECENPGGGAGQVLRPDVHRGRVALITGGGTGIGRAIALDMARCGADVVISGRRSEPLEKTAAEIEALGARVLAVPADIREEEQVTDLVDRALEARSAGSTSSSTTPAASSRPGRGHHQQGMARRAPPRRRRHLGGHPGGRRSRNDSAAVGMHLLHGVLPASRNRIDGPSTSARAALENLALRTVAGVEPVRNPVDLHRPRHHRDGGHGGQLHRRGRAQMNCGCHFGRLGTAGAFPAMFLASPAAVHHGPRCMIDGVPAWFSGRPAPKVEETR